MQARNEIRIIIKKWLNDVFRDNVIPTNVLALNFHIQSTHEEFEMYLTGHDDFYYDHDTWLQSEVYEPRSNFQGLGVKSNVLSVQEMHDIYKHEVYEFLKDNLNGYPENVHYFNCRYPGGVPELLLEK